MTPAEDLVRSTTRALAGTVQVVRPLPPLSLAPARPAEVSHRRGWHRAGRRLLPLAAAASVVVIMLASVIVTHHLASPSRTQGATGTIAQPPRPEFYMTATYSASGPNVLRLQVRRTVGGAVTASTSIPAANMGWGGYLTAAASDRAFFIAHYPCNYGSTAVVVTTFYRITITGSGRISAIAAVRRVQGIVTDLAVSPDGSQMAYNALPGGCNSVGFRSPAAGAVSLLDLSTGAVRTWQDTTAHSTVGGLSWTPDGRTLVVEEFLRGSRQPELTVFGLDTTSSGGSLQAHSTTLLQQQTHRCATCVVVVAALAGPDGGLTVLETQATEYLRTRVLVVSVPAAAGSPRTVLYSGLTDALPGSVGVFADSSGQWLLLWATSTASDQSGRILTFAPGWISGGRLHPLAGAAQVFPQGIAW
jgi:hypothetical protein